MSTALPGTLRGYSTNGHWSLGWGGQTTIWLTHLLSTAPLPSHHEHLTQWILDWTSSSPLVRYSCHHHPTRQHLIPSAYAPDGTCGFQAFAHMEGLKPVSPSSHRVSVYDLTDPHERTSLCAFYTARLTTLRLCLDNSTPLPPIIHKLEALILRWSSSPSLPTSPFPHHLWADATEFH